VVEDSPHLRLGHFVLEGTGRALVVPLGHVVEGGLTPVTLSLVQPNRQDVQLDSLELLLRVLFVITLTTNITRDIINLTLTLLDSRVELHGVIAGVAERLLEVSNLTRKFSLGRLVFSILLFDLRLILQLDRLLLEHSAFHVLDHFFLLLAELIVHEFHPMDFLTHGNDF